MKIDVGTIVVPIGAVGAAIMVIPALSNFSFTNVPPTPAIVQYGVQLEVNRSVQSYRLQLSQHDVTFEDIIDDDDPYTRERLDDWYSEKGRIEGSLNHWLEAQRLSRGEY